MDVTKSNFNAILPEIKDAISKSSFLSIDCEFSGLHSGSRINAFDTQKQYYEKLKKNSQKFLVLQFGLGIFRYDENEKMFKQKCYNFYIFPRPTNRNTPDHNFLCQSSSIDFLAGHNFDFNKVFRDGISYLNKQEEEKYLEALKERQKLRANNDITAANGVQNPIPIPNDDKKTVENIMKLIEQFLASDDEEMILPQCNAFIRRLIYQTTTERFKTRVTLETRVMENKDRVLFVIKPETPEKRAEKEMKRREQEMQELQDAVGFSAVIQFISESGKLVIGHNMILDLLHIIDKFMTPLPDDYDEFKDCLKCLFPRLLDTKFMASASVFKDLINSTVLGHLLNIIQKEPFDLPAVAIETNCEGYTLDCPKEHEAGYDAFITGVCFLALSNYLGKSETPIVSPVLPDSALLRTYINKLYLMKLQDCNYINIKGIDPKPPRDHVLHITFPKEWKMSEITQLFSPFGSVHVAWIDETSAYVGLHNRDQTAVALHTLSQSDTYTVMSYARHQALQNTNLPIAPSPKPNYRKKKTLELSSLETRKRRRVPSVDESTSKRRIETITEQPEEEESSISKLTKMFDENSAWD